MTTFIKAKLGVVGTKYITEYHKNCKTEYLIHTYASSEYRDVLLFALKLIFVYKN